MQSEEKTAEQRLVKRAKARPIFDLLMGVVRIVDIALRLYEKFFNDDNTGG